MLAATKTIVQRNRAEDEARATTAEQKRVATEGCCRRRIAERRKRNGRLRIDHAQATMALAAAQITDPDVRASVGARRDTTPWQGRGRAIHEPAVTGMLYQATPRRPDHRPASRFTRTFDDPLKMDLETVEVSWQSGRTVDVHPGPRPRRSCRRSSIATTGSDAGDARAVDGRSSGRCGTAKTATWWPPGATTATWSSGGADGRASSKRSSVWRRRPSGRCCCATMHSPSPSSSAHDLGQFRVVVVDPATGQEPVWRPMRSRRRGLRVTVRRSDRDRQQTVGPGPSTTPPSWEPREPVDPAMGCIRLRRLGSMLHGPPTNKPVVDADY